MRTLRTSFFVLLLILTSCSSSRKTSLLPLPTTSRGALRISEPLSGETSFTEVRSNREHASMVGYATALRSCGYPEKSSLRGTTRQIFVGLENLRILKQEPVEFSPHRLWAVDATAQSEGIPIHVAAYTLKQNDCFVDFVLWTPLSVEKETLSSEKTEQEFAELRANFQTLVQEVLGTL